MIVKGKIYLGSTNDYNKRWKQHEDVGEDMPLHRAIKDQGIVKNQLKYLKLLNILIMNNY